MVVFPIDGTIGTSLPVHLYEGIALMHRDTKHLPVARKQLNYVPPVRGVRLDVADKKAGSLKMRLLTVRVGSLAHVALFTALSPVFWKGRALASRRA